MYQYKVKNNRVFKLTKDGKTIAKYNSKKIVFSDCITKSEIEFFILHTNKYLQGCGAVKKYDFIENLKDVEILKNVK